MAKNKLLQGASMKPTYKTTVFACFVGYIVQAIVNNFAPLLFITFFMIISI
jgi:hypothetical protein